MVWSIILPEQLKRCLGGFIYGVAPMIGRMKSYYVGGMRYNLRMKNLKIISWNIAGCRKMKSDAHFDYEPEDLDYFANEISKFDPDVVCIQENLCNSERSVASDLGKQLSFKHVYDVSAKHVANHIDSDYELGMAILSRNAFLDAKSYFYPDPLFDLFWKDGSKAAVHHKFLQVVSFGNFYVANTQMLPILLWGHQYNEREGMAFAKGIEEVLMKLERPLIFCGDFNFNDPERVYTRFCDKIQLKNCLPDQPTRPGGNPQFNKPDHIYYSPEFEVVRSEIVQTQTDSFLCFTELTFSKNER